MHGQASCVNREPVSAALILICISTEQGETTTVSDTCGVGLEGC